MALALVGTIEADASADHTDAELAAGAGDPPRQLTALIALDRRLFERSGDLITLLIDAGTVATTATATMRKRSRTATNLW